MTYRKEIDGLRALAVLSVILFHAGFSWIQGGFIGVDIFYVISGYLITGIILREKLDGEFPMTNFYLRRAKRILPALFLVAGSCLVPAWLWMDANQLELFSKSLIALCLFGSNIFFWKSTGYFGGDGQEMPLLHTWSLAVEEQYYLILPLALTILWRFGLRRVFWCVAAAAAASLLLAEYGWRSHPDATFYLMPSRAWELLAGALIAFAAIHNPLHERVSLWQQQLLALAGLSLILVALFTFTANTPTPSLYALIPVIGAVLIIAFATRQTLVGQWLSHPILVGIGLISYSAYLWHQPLFAFARIRSMDSPSLELMTLLCAASLALAYLSWKYVEQPARKFSLSTPHVSFAALATSMALCAAGFIGLTSHGNASRYTDEQNALLEYLHYPHERYFRERTCFMETEQTFKEFDPACYQDLVTRPHTTLLWGDSHAASMVAGIYQQLGDRPKAQLTATDCPPILDFDARYRPHCRAINDGIFKLIAAAKNPRVLLAANWEAHYQEAGYLPQLEKTVDKLQAAGAEVIVIGSLPHWRPSLPQIAVRKMLSSSTPLTDMPDRIYSNMYTETLTADQAIFSIAKTHHVTAISMLELLCEDRKCDAFVRQGKKLTPATWDDAHLTYDGSLHAAEALFRNLKPPALKMAAG